MTKYYSKLWLAFVWILAVIALVKPISSYGFIHPGVLNSQSELQTMKSEVASKTYPWYGAFLWLQQDSRASSNYVAIPVGFANTNYPNHSYQIEYDSCAAYENALEWYVTENQNYAKEAESIIDGWAYTMTNMSQDANISAYIAALKFSSAAEILSYESSGWSSTNYSKLQGMEEYILYPILQDALLGTGWPDPGDGNQGIGDARGIMAIAITCNNTNMYNEAVNCFEGNSASTNPCVAVTYYIDTNGCPGESGRDQAHSQDGIASFAEMAKIAENQGNSGLWSYANNRLLAGFEWLAKYNLGNTNIWSNHGTCYTSYGSLSSIDRGQWKNMYEMAYNHYAVTEGLSAPYTSQVAALLRPENTENDDPGAGTLLYTVNSGPSPQYSGTYKIVNLNSGLAIGTVSGGTSQGTELDQEPYSGEIYQQWILTGYGTNRYQILNADVSSTLPAASGTSPTSKAAYVHIWDNGNNNNSVWQLNPTTGGFNIVALDTILMPLPITNLVWDVYGASTADGALIDTWTSNGGSNQIFTISSP
jgi:hypothetical protein